MKTIRLVEKPFVLMVVLVVLMGSGAYAEDSTPAENIGPDTLATYDGGQVTMADWREAMRNPILLQVPYLRDEKGQPTTRKLIEYLAMQKYLLAEADQLDLDSKPYYQMDMKFLPDKALAEMLKTELRASIPIPTDKQVRDFFEEHRDTFLPVERFLARRIVIEREKHGDDAARQLAEAALQEIQSGVPFEEAAKGKSDQPVPGKPIDYPWSTWAPQHQRLLARLGEGRVSDVLETAQGYEIVEVHGLVPEEQFDFQRRLREVREVIIGEEYDQRFVELRNRAVEAFPFQCGEQIDVRDLGTDELKTLLAIPAPPVDSSSPAEKAVPPATPDAETPSAQSQPVGVEATTPLPEGVSAPAPTASAELDSLIMTSGSPVPLPDEPDKPVIRCGKLILTARDVHWLAHYRAMPREGTCSEMIEWLRNNRGDDIILGEFARGEGYDKRSEYALRLALLIDQQRADYAKKVLIPRWARTQDFGEERIKERYDKEWKETVDPMLEYDLLVIPAPYDPSESKDRYDAKLAKAEELAMSAIGQAVSGLSLEEIAAANPGYQFMKEQKRVVNEKSELEALVAKAKPGDIVSKPYRDFGGWCVMQVTKYEPRQKVPYEMARRYVVDKMQSEYTNSFLENFEATLLQNIHYTENARLMERLPEWPAQVKGAME